MDWGRASGGSHSSGREGDRGARPEKNVVHQARWKYDMLSFVERLRQARAELAAPADPWMVRLERVRGKIGVFSSSTLVTDDMRLNRQNAE